MIIFNAEQNSEKWFDIRKGKVSGSKAYGLQNKRGGAKKIGFYELLAERIAEEKTDEPPIERGSRLEDEAIKELEKEFGKIERIGLAVRDDNKNIGVSMDGRQEKEKRAFEVKCLSSAKHLEAYFEKKIPNEYIPQAIQYFVVDEDLETLVFSFYDPRVPSKELHYQIIKREDVEDKITSQLEHQENLLKEIDEMVAEIAF